MDLSQFIVELSAAWAIAKKDLKMYYARPGTIMFGIMFPLFMFLSFAVGRDIPAAEALPGLTSMVVMFSSSSIGPFSIPLERRLKTFDRLLAAPISFYSILLGKVLAGMLYGVATGVFPILIGVLFFNTLLVQPEILAFSLTLSAACFASMGVMFASYPTKYPGNVTIAMNFIRLPMIFVSGVFTPLEQTPAFLLSLAMLSPLTYANDLMRVSFKGEGYFNPVVDWVSLLVFTCLFLAAGVKLHSKFTELEESPRTYFKIKLQKRQYKRM
ncbi:MAG: ABC transporter permease [Thermoplasmata archaeon]|nr:MAG: ABC transporter permease [Thermoplasmata archaeon]